MLETSFSKPYLITVTLTLFRLYSSIARYAESVSLTKISSLLRACSAVRLCDSPYEPVDSAAIFSPRGRVVLEEQTCIPLTLSPLCGVSCRRSSRR